MPLLALALAALLLSGSGAFSAPGNVHESVFSWARQHPGQQVPVIVQTNGDSSGLVSKIAGSGGAVERELALVQALDASIPAGEIGAIASDPAVSWISLDAPVVPTGFVDTGNLASAYPFAVNAPAVWNAGITGSGLSVAVIDTGISPRGHEDFKNSAGNSRVIARVVVNDTTSNVTDGYGHGTHVAGIVGGDGSLLASKYVGIAPEVNLINVKVAGEDGSATLADVVAGLEWVFENKEAYNIRVVNLSLHSSVAQSYTVDPLDAAVEFLWFNDVVVVVAAGNSGDAADAVHYPPANDPFVITVGAFGDQGTPDFGDDTLAPWSGRGTTQDGFAKPEVVAPGRNIVSVIDSNSILYKTYPDKVVDKDYFRLSGTSMAAGVVSGVAALVRQAHPEWTTEQVKCTVTAQGRNLSAGDGVVPDVARLVAAIAPATGCNDGVTPNFLLSQAPIVQVGVVAYVLGSDDPVAEAAAVGLDLDAVGRPGTTLDTVDWSAIKWSAIKWSAIKWSAIEWSAIKWSAIKWSAIDFDAIKWSSDVNFDAIKWSAIKWSAIKWSAIKWSAIKWSGGTVDFDAIKWSAIKWSVFPE
ncbi:MAG: S8 family peptidase [Dehalococcoidia bacterium]|nr:S8 family peptidase [Dehalococcoidia bacterium]